MIQFQALTTRSARDGLDLERLETLGDSLLKLASTDWLYHNHGQHHEGALSDARSRQVGSEN